MRIVFTGGGSGGHLIPFAPIIETLRVTHLEQRTGLPKRLDPNELQLYFVGVADKRARELFAQLAVPVFAIPSGKLRSYPSSQNIIDIIFRLPVGVIMAIVILWRLMPDVVVSKGGYGSVPVILSAFLFRIPILMHDSDTVPGSVTRHLARFASTIALSFDEAREQLLAQASKTVVTGTPVRSDFGRMSQLEAKQRLNLSPDDLAVVILGGSQGARQINELILKILPRLVMDASILHITGEREYSAVESLARKMLETSSYKQRYHALPYVSTDIETILNAADVVVSRAGATVLAELARLGRAALLIPLPADVSTHQRSNAAVFEKSGAARVLDPENLGVNLFEQSIKELVMNSDLRHEFAVRIKSFDRPRAARDISNLVYSLAKGNVPIYAQTAS